jgi:hypothetical protein
VVVFLCGIATTSRAEVVTLYDANLASQPGDQPWLFYFPEGTVTESLTAGGTQLTTDTAARAGYSSYSISIFPPDVSLKNGAFHSLDRSTGFALSFEMQLLAESHVSNDRAGFSVIALANDARGVELGFWEDRVFAQADSPLFTRSEEGLFDTTAAPTDYLLTIQDDGYVLTADTDTILSGPLRDYSSFDGTLGPIPYNLSDYLFFGDNTTSAGADVVIGSIELRTQLVAIPEPTSLSALGWMAWMAWAWPRRRHTPGTRLTR